MTDNEIWYRYEDIRYAPPIDEYERPIREGEIQLKLRKFKVLSHTKKGVWVVWKISSFIGSEKEKKFILKDARKRHACPTKEEALESYKARKKRQIRILKSQLKYAEKALELVEPTMLQKEIQIGGALWNDWSIKDSNIP